MNETGDPTTAAPALDNDWVDKERRREALAHAVTLNTGPGMWLASADIVLEAEDFLKFLAGGK